jgi:adenylate kinase
MSRVVILLGAPGAGKGTQAAQLSQKLGLAHISTGDLFRENLKNNTPLGDQAREFMNSGRLVPDGLVLEMLFDRVAKPDCEVGYLLDGFPRTLPQAAALEVALGSDADVVALNIEIQDSAIIERATGRLLCRGCTAIYHRTFSPPAQAGICGECGGELFQREDDQVEVVAKRLNVYHAETAPLVEYYSDRDVLFGVNGEQAPDHVTEALLAELSASSAADERGSN